MLQLLTQVLELLFLLPILSLNNNHITTITTIITIIHRQLLDVLSLAAVTVPLAPFTILLKFLLFPVPLLRRDLPPCPPSPLFVIRFEKNATLSSSFEWNKICTNIVVITIELLLLLPLTQSQWFEIGNISWCLFQFIFHCDTK